ncbi:DegT/DnrJ/EryC1/StrS family aminotransferase [Bacillus norwichensis]|uniref:DegT/DnrJ/EryC1/StrS family aminotransferase n=1 Tax=Bacillus norwichensis TaxID=2762217 RepID=A0ABR8VRJ6_9BACI|nr:DegT/DnrJ/EryC1/StrS family aminotransferase [Bacillus norwichensis]MBD8007342.1 DegT/DnrJ/EryC1/StrS family aminotransferase [Bacillus norwichensis]
MIPITDPKGQLTFIQDKIINKINEVLVSGKYILGPHVTELENEIAGRLGVSDAIAVANGTDALVLTLHSYGIGMGDEVITTPFSFFATAEAVSRVGATPVFVDIDETFNIDPLKINEKITSATKAILPVHLFGQPAAMDEINSIAAEHGLVVIEDACQAFGAKYKGKEVGSLGNAACFSFFPTKNLSTIGDGGVIVTSDKKAAKRIRALRAHGSTQKYFHSEIGYNSRLDELHAAILLICLEYIDSWNEKRRVLAKRYLKELKDTVCLTMPPAIEHTTHVYHLFCVQSEYRKEMIDCLNEAEIQTGIYYPRCIHLQEAYASLGYRKGDFPNAELLSDRLFAIPLFPTMTIEEQDQVISALRNFEVSGQ